MIIFLTLITKYLNNDISESEREELRKWIIKDIKNETFFREEVKKWYLEKEGIDINPEIAYVNFINKLKKNKPKVYYLKTLYKYSKYAAIFVGLIIVWNYFNTRENNTIQSTPTIVKNDITLPKDKIKITQADGTITFIDLKEKKEIVTATGQIIGSKNNNSLVIGSKNESNELKYMQVSIPKGELLQLTLSDGTKVWLNAASTLKFPQQFIASEKTRLVYLEGEAFFDVSTNKEKPFIVKTKEIDVQVLGTQFNVSSYADEESIKTTLVEGSVKVNDQNNRANTLLLMPSHQAVFSKNKSLLDQKKVNTDRYTSWIYKKITLHNQSFSEVYKRIERAYNVVILNNNKKLNETKFTGEFDVENIQEILQTFSETLKFTYEINGNNITINP